MMDKTPRENPIDIPGNHSRLQCHACGKPYTEVWAAGVETLMGEFYEEREVYGFRFRCSSCGKVGVWLTDTKGRQTLEPAEEFDRGIRWGLDHDL